MCDLVPSATGLLVEYFPLFSVNISPHSTSTSAGIHAKGKDGKFFTILESPIYHDEVTGLSFSPDNMHMYLAYQVNGILFDVYREDGYPFDAKSLDVKYHGK